MHALVLALVLAASQTPAMTVPHAHVCVDAKRCYSEVKMQDAHAMMSCGWQNARCNVRLRMPVCMQSDLSSMQDDKQCYMPCRTPMQCECDKCEMIFAMQCCEVQSASCLLHAVQDA